MRGRLARVGVAGVGVAFVLAGCGGDTGGQATASSTTKQSAPSSTSAAPSSSAGSSGSADAASVAWMDSFCGEVLTLTSMGQIPEPDVKQGDVAGAHKQISAYLGKVAARMSSFVQGLKDLPPAPTPEADKAVQKLLDIFEPAANKIKDVAATLEAADPNDKQALAKAGQAMQSFGKALKNAENPMNALKGTELVAAAKNAPNCKKLGA